MINYSATRYIYSRVYKKRKTIFADYAATNARIAATGGVNAATVMIYRNAMTFEINEIIKYLFIFLATDYDMARRHSNRITCNPDEILERYSSSLVP